MVWNGPHPEDGKDLSFQPLPKTFGAKPPDLEPEPQLNAPLDLDTLKDILKRMK